VTARRDGGVWSSSVRASFLTKRFVARVCQPRKVNRSIVLIASGLYQFLISAWIIWFDLGTRRITSDWL